MSTLIDQLFAEHIPLLGAPSIIVTRGFAWKFYEELGFEFNPGSFSSPDFMAMHPRPVEDPLTDLEEPWAANILAAIRNGTKEPR